ncbi:MAG: hypothetical protein HWN51_05705, partial [Desulfobacterales bacterium]|nr:hypothetical protein [Desulfobacterales bacterium]
MEQYAEVDWIKLYSGPDQVEASEASADCPICGERCAIIENETEVIDKDV